MRLAPVDYHRFHFPSDGKISKSQLIDGYYYSVSTLAIKRILEYSVKIKENILYLKQKNLEI